MVKPDDSSDQMKAGEDLTKHELVQEFIVIVGFGI